MIPLRFHFIWIGRSFPFVNRLAVESVLQTNPGAEIIVHFQDPPLQNGDWEALREKVTFRPVDMTELLSGLPTSLQVAAQAVEKVSGTYLAGKSNVIRYLILCREGGIYLDFDTLTLQSFAPLLDAPAFIGEEEVFKCDDDRVAGNYTWDFPLMAALFGLSLGMTQANSRWLENSALFNLGDRFLRKFWSARKLNNAVLGSEPGNPFFIRALELIPETDAGLRYALGPMLMNRIYATPVCKSIRRLNKDVFYAIPPSQTFRFFHGQNQILPPEAMAVHWCSSNHKRLASGLNRMLIENFRKPCLYFRLSQEILRRGI